MALLSTTPSKRFTLFPDQEDALRAIREAYERGVRRQLVVAPTGAGKTLLVARVPELIGDPRMVYVAHREELLHQTLGTLCRERPDRRAGLERAASRAGLRDLTVVASIQSLWRPDRFVRYRPEDWPLMAVDERRTGPWHSRTSPCSTTSGFSAKTDSRRVRTAFCSGPRRPAGGPMRSV